jgi:hypothetical protein
MSLARLGSEPATPAVIAAAAKYKQNDDDDQKCCNVHFGFLEVRKSTPDKDLAARHVVNCYDWKA